ncbi:MAG: peptidoglycan-binding protein [Frankiales bacterium]|nr:peptidoglycan-binding protein [Frankiales bacterium]
MAASIAVVLVGGATQALAATATISSVDPAYALVGHTVTIVGADLAQATDVTFAGSGNSTVDAGAPTVLDANHVQTTVPTGAVTGPITVVTPDGSPTIGFTVQQPTVSSISVNRGVVVYPQRAVVRARLSAAGVAGVPNQPARLQRKDATGGWHNAQRLQQTASDGSVRWRVAPARATAYRVVFKDVPAYLGSSTSAVHVAVVPRLRLHVPSLAPILTRTKLRGTVQPPPPRQSRVTLQKKSGGHWRKVTSVRVGRHGAFTATVSLPATGRYIYRVVRARGGGLLAAASASHRVDAVQRSLHDGMSGPDVVTLQKRLRHLHYDLGHISGTFDFDTVHAVVAFEKVQGMSRDGVVGTKVWEALGHPKQPHLRHPQDAASAGVEVNLTKQVLLYAVHGHIVRILDSSTGGGYYYTGSDGTQQRAITPTGHFAVVYQRSGWVTSKLGTLYRPAYFNNQGYAIHGETEVPSYPASHGCVRITVPARDRLGSKLYNGLSVWIYS